MTQGIAAGQVSPDGQFQWDGSQWQPITGTTWEPTDWTRPMQLAVAAYWFVAGLFAILTPFLFSQLLKETALRQLQSQSPNLTPDQQQQAIGLALGFGTALAVIFGLIYLALGLLSVIRRFAWVFYVDLVLLGLSAIGVITNLISLGSRNPAQPAFLSAISLLLSAVALLLFAWMLIGRIQRGVWACRKVPRTAAS